MKHVEISDTVLRTMMEDGSNNPLHHWGIPDNGPSLCGLRPVNIMVQIGKSRLDDAKQNIVQAGPVKIGVFLGV